MDVGAIYIGISISNPKKKKEAIPLITFERKEFVKKFPKVIKEFEPIQLMVVGVPSCNIPNTKKIINFIQRDFKIMNLQNIPIVLQDEKNSTKESRLYQMENENDTTFNIDSYSAKVILERFLRKLK
eukprot:gene6338-10345_t